MKRRCRGQAVGSASRPVNPIDCTGTAGGRQVLRDGFAAAQDDIGLSVPSCRFSSKAIYFSITSILQLQHGVPQHCAVNGLSWLQQTVEANMWTYVQVNGQLLDEDGTLVDTGYSGCDEGKNNPSMQAVPDMGPIPKGKWTILGPPFNTPDHGPNVLRLEPEPGTNTFGRDGFLMHGDNKDFPGTASKRCIIMAPGTRPKVWASGDHELNVVAAPEAPGDDDTAAG